MRHHYYPYQSHSSPLSRFPSVFALWFQARLHSWFPTFLCNWSPGYVNNTKSTWLNHCVVEPFLSRIFLLWRVAVTLASFPYASSLDLIGSFDLIMWEGHRTLLTKVNFCDASHATPAHFHNCAPHDQAGFNVTLCWHGNIFWYQKDFVLFFSECINTLGWLCWKIYYSLRSKLLSKVKALKLSIVSNNNNLAINLNNYSSL